jgi:hypothetical protein
MATYTGGCSISPDKKFSVYGNVHGAYGHAFADYTWKTVCLDIFEGPTAIGDPLLSRKYRVQGSDVCWDAKWDTFDNVTFTLFDYGRGISHFDARNKSIAARQIQTTVYHYDSRKDSFVEK